MKAFKFLSLLLVTCMLSGLAEANVFFSQGNIQEQKIPKAIRKIIQAIEKANVFVLHQPEQASTLISDLNNNYVLLSKLATSDELEELIRTHKNAVVRIYAFKALTTQVKDIPATIMNTINNDTATIKCISRDKNENVEVRSLVQNFLN